MSGKILIKNHTGFVQDTQIIDMQTGEHLEKKFAIKDMNIHMPNLDGPITVILSIYDVELDVVVDKKSIVIE